MRIERLLITRPLARVLGCDNMTRHDREIGETKGMEGMCLQTAWQAAIAGVAIEHARDKGHTNER